MGTAIRMTEWMKRGGLVLAVASVLLMGCQAARLTYKGAKVREPFRIGLEDGTSRSSRYQSADVIVEYEVYRKGNELQISGVGEFTAKIRHAYTQVPYFHLSLFLTDQYGYVLEAKGIRTPGIDDPQNRFRFNETIVLPPGTTGFAFSYDAEGRMSGGRQEGGGGKSTFWEIPIVR